MTGNFHKFSEKLITETLPSTDAIIVVLIDKKRISYHLKLTTISKNPEVV